MGQRNLCSLLLVAVLLVAGVAALPKHTKPRPHYDIAKSLPAFMGPRPTVPFTSSRGTIDAVSDVAASNFAQQIDHTSNSNNATFKHRYFQNTKYANGKQIHFLYVEGAHVADPTKIGDETMPIVSLAQSVGATLWMLEHRFYGNSRPFERMYNKNLPYLSSQQAVEDIAAFINAQNTASGESNPRWVLFGSAYSGALVLWFRNRYPNLCVGAVASSPLISLELDNYQYELNLGESLLGNSFECYRGVVLSARAIREEMQYWAGINRINSQLHLTPGLNLTADDYKTFEFVHMLLMPLIQYPVMYNHVNKGVFGTSGGIDDLCAIMSDFSDPDIDKVYRWATVIFPDIYGSQDANGNWQIGSSYESFLRTMWRNKYADDGVELQASMRAWMWQSCFEFGTWTTTDNGRNIFGTEVQNSYWMALCSDIFGHDIHVDNYDIDNLLWVLGNTSNAWDTTKTYNGTNVVITSGGHDPWRTLVPNATLDASAVIFVADGIGHNADLQPPMDSDPDSLKQARTTISSNVQAWLAASATSTAATSISLPAKVDGPPSGPELPQPKNIGSKVYRESEHPDPKFLAHIRVNTIVHAPGDGRHSAVSSRHMAVEQTRRRAFGIDKSIADSALGNMTMHANQQTWFIEQPVDHFDASNTLTFKQKYLSDDRYVDEQSSAVFLYIGDATSESINMLTMSEDYWQWVQWAKDFRARMYALEHRYYGDSQPFTNTTVESLQWLQTEQVLADITNFISTMNAMNNASSPPWVLFGGSYAGVIAAAMRVRYPDLTAGAIASSAPIQAKVDFYEYERWVSWATNKYGFAECGESIRKVMYGMQRQMASKEGRAFMKYELCYLNDFQYDNYVDEKDLELLYSVYVDFIDYALAKDDNDHYFMEYVCWMYEDCGDLFGLDEWGDCEWLSSAVHYFLRNPDVSDQEKADTINIFVDATRNASDYAEALALTKPVVGPIYQAAYKTRKEKGQMRVRSPRAAERERMANARTVQDLQAPRSADSDYDSNCDSDYYCGGDGDALGEFLCECYYSCEWFSYDEHVFFLEQVDLEDPTTYKYQDKRTWFFQMCTEWGHMFSDNYGRNIYEDTYPVNWMLDQCSDIFGEQYNRSSLESTIRNTNYLYGGQDNYNGTNIMFINGNEDPWSALSIYDPLHVPLNLNSVMSILMNGVSHCADMYLWRHGDKDTIVQAQKKIKNHIRWYVQKWNKAQAKKNKNQ